jgi:hypothetical protein
MTELSAAVDLISIGMSVCDRVIAFCTLKSAFSAEKVHISVFCAVIFSIFDCEPGFFAL